MAPKKRSKPDASPSTMSSHYEDYLLYKSLVRKYRDLCKLKILPTRYIVYEHLAIYNIEMILNSVGLHSLLDIQNKDPYYPFLVYLFYANLSITTTPDGAQTITTSVKNISISFTADELAGILGIPSGDVDLMSTETIDPDVEKLIFLPGCSYPMNNKSIGSSAKIIARIIAHNLIPKTGSFDHFASDKVNAVYALFAKTRVNWANVFLNNMATNHQKFLPFGCFITRILKHFGVPLANEPKVEVKRDFFDKASLARMNLPTSLISGSKPRSKAASSSASASASSSRDFETRLDNLESKVDTILKGVTTLLSYQRQSLGIPDSSSSSSSDSEEDAAVGDEPGDASGSDDPSDGDDDDVGDDATMDAIDE